MAVTGHAVNDLIRGFTAAALRETGDEVFLHQLWHQTVERALAGRMFDCGVGLHAGYDRVDGVGAVFMFFEKSDQLAALFGLISHDGCLSAVLTH